MVLWEYKINVALPRAWTRTHVTRVDSSRTRTRVRNFLTRVRTGITWLIVPAEPVCNSCRHYAYSGLGKITNSFLARTSTLTRINWVNSSPDSSPGLEYSSSQKNSWLVLLELTRPDSSPSSIWKYSKYMTKIQYISRKQNERKYSKDVTYRHYEKTIPIKKVDTFFILKDTFCILRDTSRYV